MKNWMEKNLGRRLLSLALALCMVLSVLPPMAYADGDPADGSVEGTSVVPGNSAGDPAADPNAGGPAADPNAGDPSADPNAGDPADDPNAGSPADNPNEGGETKKTQDCTCVNRCSEVDATNSCPLCAVSIDNCAGAQLCEHNLAADCRLCAVKEMLAALPEAPEGADWETLTQQLSQLEQALGLLTEEETASFDLTHYQALTAYLASLPQVVTAWSWIEKDEEAPVLAEELGALVVSFATIENPLYLWTVQDVLPGKLSATVNGEAVELTLGGWSCPDYPAAGCYQGTYTFTTTLPEGYVLGEDVAALEIPVIFMDGTSQWNGTESSVSYIGSDNTPGTCETYTAVTDADAATWSDGWYVVSGNVTIESLTVNGAVSLILKNGSSLKVNSLTVSGGALTVYGQEQKSGTLTIKGGMELLSAPITVVSGAVCAEITLKDTITSSSNIAIPAGMSVDLNMNGKSIGFNDGCGFELGEDSKLALWNEDWTGAFFLYGIKANVPLKGIVKDGFAFFDHTSDSDVFITTIYSNPDTKEYSGKLNVFFHDHDWDYQQVEGDEEHHKAICKDCLTERFETHDLSDLTAKNFDNDYHNLVCECGKIIKTESHVLVSRYYSGTQHLVYCESNCGYERKLSDHVYDEETGVCACGAEKTSYLGTDGAIHTVGCLDFCVESRLHEGNYFHANYNDQIWYVARGTDTVPGITLLGEPSYNLILADGCDVSVTDSVNCPAMTIWGQENGTGRLTVTDANNTAIYATSSLTINGGTVVASGAKAFSALPAMAQGMMAYVVDGEAETPVLRASAADSFGNAQKMKVTRCNQSHDGSGEVAYEYVNESTHRPVCPYCGVSLGGENQPHSFGDSGSCACGAVRGEDGQGVLITTLSGTYSGVTLTGTYLVTGQTTFTDRAEVAGSAKLILADGCTLTAWDGIRVAGGNTLEIEGQDGHTGRLVIQGDGGSHAPIGGNAEEASGNITIDGCCVEAGGGSAYGIGVSVNGTSGIVTIRNATVTTTVLPEGASITDSIIRMDGNATVYGNATLRSTLNVFDEKSLTVPEGASLTVPQNVSVNISGSLQGSGTIYLLSNDFNANTNNSTVRIWCLLELEDCTVSGEGVLIAHQGKYFCEAGKEITLTPSEGTQADSWKVSYSVTKEVGDEEWETVVTTNYYPGSFTMPAHPVSVKPHIHTFESGVCTVCGAVRAVYWDEKGKEQTITQCTILTEEMNRPTSGWYLVTGTLNLENGLYIVGDVKLILADGAQLIASSGIWDGYGSDSTLTIYGQESGTGALRAVSDSSYGAAIGVNNVVINGGNVYAENSSKGFSSSTVMVNRGNVEVTVGEDRYAFYGSLTASQSATIRINAGANLCDSVTGSFIFFKGSEGTVQGAVERTSVPMGEGESLLVPEGSSLTLGSTTYPGPVCLKAAQTPTFFASSLRTVVAAANTALTEENAEAYYPLEYTDCTVSGLNETNSFTRSDVTGPLVKAGTKVQLGYQEPFGKLFTCFDAGELSIGSDNSFTMPSQKVTVKAVFQDAALAVQYTDNGASAYRNYAGTAVTEAFNFAMEQEQATVCLINDVNESNSVELTKGSITLKSDFPTGSTDTTPHKLDVDINLKGGQLTIENVNITKTLTVNSGKLNVTGGYIDDLTVKSADLSDVVISGGSFGYISTTGSSAQYKSIYFIMAEGKTLADSEGTLLNLGNSNLSPARVVDHDHRWTYNNQTPDNHVQTCTGCLTSVTVPHKAGQNGLCKCGLSVVSYVNHLGEDMGTKGCMPVSSERSLHDGWYVVKGTVDVGSTNIRGNVNLILTPGSEYKGQEFYIETNSTLTVWSQSTGWTKEAAGLLYGSDKTDGDGTLVLNGGCVKMYRIDCAVKANGGFLNAFGTNSMGQSISGEFSTAHDGCALIDVLTLIEVNKQASWSGIFHQGNNVNHYTVYGKQTLNQSIPGDGGLYNLHVPKGAALDYKSGLNGSDVYVDGTFTGEYDNVYYRLTYPEGTTITHANLPRVEATFNGGTYYVEDLPITIEDSTDSTWLLNNTRLEGNTFSMPAQASVLEKGTVINYYDENGAPQTTYGKLFPTGNEPITLSDNGGAPAWFLLSESKTLDKRLEIEGSVNLVVDAASGKLIANQGIHVGPNATLKLYLSTAEKQDGFGRVDATIAYYDDYTIDDAVIGGNKGEASGSIFFNGLDVTVSATATNEQGCINGAGIGGGKSGNAGPIVVNRGSISVNIQAGRSVTGAGIGGGYGASNTSFTINGGSVTVQMTAVPNMFNNIEGAGIGGGYNGSTGGSLNFLGGTVNVTLTGKSSAAGIGGGAYGNAGTITISGSANVTSTIDARDSTNKTQGAAIGSGCEGKGGSVSISGGNVTAEIKNGESFGAAIGNGYYKSQPVDITITGGTVTATLASSTTANGAAIGGGGEFAKPGKILITGGEVTAKNESPDSHIAAIGGGYSMDCSYIAITGGKVTATAPYNAIGGGRYESGNVVGEGGTFIQLTKDVTFDNSKATSVSANGIKYIKIDDNTGYFRVYGNVTLDGSIAIPAGVNLLVPQGAKLTMGGAGNQGIIYVAGTLVGGDGSIYYQIKFADNTTGATASSEEQNGVTTFQGKTYGLPNAKISLSGYDSWKEDGDAPVSSTFTMPAKVLTIEGHNHTLTYSAITQSGHQEVCETSGCDYENPTAAHRFGEDRKCPCGCVQTSYVDLDGVTQTVAALPIPGDGQLKAADIEQGWYVLRGTIEETALHISGSVNLILEDGAVLTDRIVLRQSSSLTVWGQKNGTGKLALTMIEQESGTTPAEVPLTFNGGVVEVKRAWVAIDNPVVVNGGSVTAEATASSADAYAIQGNVTVTGGSLTATSTDDNAIKGNVTVKSGSLTATSTNDYAIEGNVTVKGGSLTATSTNDTAIYGNVSVSGGRLKATGKSEGISGTATVTGGWVEANSIIMIGEGSNGNGILITGDITDGVGNFTGGLLQLGTNPATVYGTPVFDRNLTTGEGEKLQSIHIPAGTSLTMAQGNTLTNNGRIYQDVGGTLNTAPVAASTGKVYYQVKLGEGIAMQGNDTTELNASNYARGDVTFSGSTDGYFVTYTDYNGRSQTAYQSGSDYPVTQPITVSPHTHSFDGQGNCTCTVHVTVKVTMGQEETFYGSLGEALEAIGDQEATITLLDDTAGTITISKGDLTIQGEKRIEGILVTGGTVKLTGGEIGSLTVQGGTVKLSGGTFGTISSGSGVVTLLEEGFAFRMEDGSWLDGFNGTDTNTLGGGTVCPVPLKNALLTGPASITYGDSQALTFSVTVNTQSTDTPALSWNRNGDDLSVTGSSCSLSDWDVSRGAGNAVQSYTVTCSASLDGYRLTARHTITINPKVLTISWSNTQFTYDGQSHNPTASSGVSGISLTLSQAQTNAGTHSAQVTGIQGTKAGNYQLPAVVTRSFTISPAAITGVTLKADSGVYTGEVQAPAAKEVKAGALTLNSGDYDLSVSPETVQNAGTYQVTITGKGNFTGSIQKSYTIAKAQPSVVPAELTITYGTKLSGCDLSGFAASFRGTKLPGSFAFDQPDVMPRVADSGTTAYRLTFTPDDGVNFHTASLEVSLTVNTRELTVDAAVQDKQYDGTNKASFISGRPALVGLVDGDVVELSHGEPYFKTVEAGTGIEIRFTDVFVISGKDSINYYLTQPAGITASIYISFKAECGKEYTVNADGWQNTDFVVTANEGYSLSGNNSTEGPWSDKLTVTQEGTGELSFYVRNNTTRAISKLVKEGYRIDKSMPTATIRFDGADETESSPRVCCKKQAVAVTITGSDAFSGVAGISCFLADAEKTEAELKAITQWMEKTSFTIPAVDGTGCFLYAKLVDNAGNTAFYRANRIIFDTSVPSISGVENGKVYYTTQTVTVSDENLKSVMLNGKSVESPVTLKGNVDETYELLITDEAGNEITVTVIMKTISSITDPVKSITGDNVTEDDRKQLEDAADKLKDLLDTVTDEDEKQKLQDELDKLEELLEILDKVKEVEELLDALPDSVTPDADKQTEQDIQDARKEFEKLSEHQQSLVDQSLKEKLERLEAELVDYQFETGADTVWNRGSGSNLQFVANGRLDKLEKVLLDGKELSNHDFTKSSPKTTIELQEAFLGTLEQGKHILELVYSDGKAETGFTVMQGTSHLDLTDLPAFDGLTEVEVDGISYPIQELDGKRHVMLPETGDLLTIYTYRNGSAENTHDNYPTGMRVFRINRSVNGVTVTELPELADLLIYSGCSIRINGNRGIRMITSMTQSNKDALTGDGLAGFTMLESGTVVQWADSFTGSLNLDSGKHNYAYKRGTADPVFATSGGLTQYTNVLVGFNLDQCSKDIVMRPYVILEDADGKQYTLYGGRVTRSISYIAWQNRDTYQPGTEAYDYVHELMGNTTAG